MRTANQILVGILAPLVKRDRGHVSTIDNSAGAAIAGKRT
jgi:hypothetical protein